MTLEELKNNDDWKHAFDEAYGHGYRYEYKNEPLDPPNPIYDVVEIIACDDGENDGLDWIGIFKLNSGQYIKLFAGCDYTGWD